MYMCVFIFVCVCVCVLVNPSVRSLYINLLGLWVIVLCSVFAGLCLYSIYKHCDPWTAGLISAPDQVNFCLVSSPHQTIFSLIPSADQVTVL